LGRVQTLCRSIVAWWRDVDLLVTPTVTRIPPPVGYLVEGDQKQRTARLAEITPYVTLFNATGQPAISLPLHWTPDGLPVGVQLVAAPGREIARFFEGYDLLLTPTLATPPVRHGSLHAAGAEAAVQALAARLGLGRYVRYGPLVEQAAARAFRFIPFTPIWNVTGQPAANLPLHWTLDGLPVGVQAVARFGDEATLLAFACQIEEAQPWRDRIPPLA